MESRGRARLGFTVVPCETDENRPVTFIHAGSRGLACDTHYAIKQYKSRGAALGRGLLFQGTCV